jgi:nicotinamide-nucleotide amidase
MNSSLELITTGSELLSGRSVNTHARVLGEALFPLGLRIARDTTLPDDAAEIEDALRSALGRVDVVIMTGGLGPTSDDLTRDIVARMTGRGIVMHEPSRQAVVARYSRMGRKVTPHVERHALVVEGAEVLSNSAGLAPGERIAVNDRTLFLLPGPPREFLAVLTEHVLPWLRANKASAVPEVRLFQVCGVGESDIVSRLEPEGFPGPGVDVSYCAAVGRVEIRLSAVAADLPHLEKAAQLVRDRIGPAIFTEGRQDLAEVVGALLKGRAATLAVAESCTGGLIGHRLTNVSGSSDYFVGGIVSYANSVKERELGVLPTDLETHGAVSEPVARQMAEGVRGRFGTTYGLAVTGIAGPSGGTPEKPVGLVYIAVAGAAGTQCKEFRFAGSREHIKDWGSQMALDLLRRRILDVASA